jgi:tripartite ATP-independent transporter DctM subunit
MDLIIFLLFVILLCLGVPIAFALLVPSIAAFALYPDLPIQLLSSRLANGYLSSSLLAIPLFIFAAEILTDINITDAIFSFINKCMGHIRGGLAYVNVVASIIFAGMSGSAAADAAGLGRVEIKAMKDQGYPPAFSAAVTAASSTIGPIIPPSIPVIVFASLAEVSTGKLLIGGFLPGIIMALFLMVGISIIGKYRGFPKTKFCGIQETWKSLVKALPGLIAPIILVGGILFGIFIPTEAATACAIYAIILGFFMRRLTYRQLRLAIKKAALDSATIMITFLGAQLIGLLVTRLHMADIAIKFIYEFTTSPAILLLIINIFLLIAGCILDPICCIILLNPFLVPLVQSFGIDIIHFGIVMILNLMIGLITPPLGGMMFITCKIAEVSMMDFLKECWPFMILLVVALIIVTYFPQTVLWLPSLFMK